MKRGFLFCHLLLLLLVFFTGCASLHQRYTNLGNPTEYVFAKNVEQVKAACRGIRAYAFGRDTEWGKIIATDETIIDIVPHYSDRYWSGKKETDVEFPEAGKIGQIEGRFGVVLSAMGDRTKVTVNVELFSQQTGRKNVIFPDFRTVGVWKDVPSDTFFEYLYLSKLGEMLGEPNMPEIRSR